MNKTKIKQGRFTVILRVEREGGYSVQCLELPGAISEGETKKEALKNIREAIKGFLEAFPEESDRFKLDRLDSKQVHPNVSKICSFQGSLQRQEIN
jgi:predicted RNase H-like HicB family nuclease